MLRHPNPWLAIWRHPRTTIAQIVSDNPKRGIWALSWLYGILGLLNSLQLMSTGHAYNLFFIVPLTILLAPIFGFISFTIMSAVVYTVGLLLKGKASFFAIRAALSWASLPLIINVILWGLLIGVFQEGLFRPFQPEEGVLLLLSAVLVGKVASVVWSLILYVNMLSEVQRFSTARSIINIILSWMAMAILLILLGLSIGFFMHS